MKFKCFFAYFQIGWSRVGRAHAFRARHLDAPMWQWFVVFAVVLLSDTAMSGNDKAVDQLGLFDMHHISRIGRGEHAKPGEAIKN